MKVLFLELLACLQEEWGGVGGRRNESRGRHYKVPEILIVTTDSLHYTDPERAEDRKPPNDLEKGLGLLKLFAGIPNLGDG